MIVFLVTGEVCVWPDHAGAVRPNAYEPVAFDLSSVPLDDVLQFRTEHHNAYRAYTRDLRRFMIELADVDESEDREALLLE